MLTDHSSLGVFALLKIFLRGLRFRRQWRYRRSTRTETLESYIRPYETYSATAHSIEQDGHISEHRQWIRDWVEGLNVVG